MACGILTLKWNNHKATCLEVLSSLYKNSLLSDATLVCEGEFYPVHKLVLSMCSEYFESLLEKMEEKHPFIVLNDVMAEELDAILSYMYKGEVDILQDKLSGLFKVAQSLKIKGLSDSAHTAASPPSKSKQGYDQSSEHRADDRQRESVTSTKMETDVEKPEDTYSYVESVQTQATEEDETMKKEDKSDSCKIKCEPYDDLDSDAPSPEFTKSTDLSPYFNNWFRSNSLNMVFDPSVVGMGSHNLGLERRALIRANGLRPMEKLYSCDMCNFVTTRSHGLKRHKMTHTGERPYACHLCTFRSIQKYYLKTHLIKEHNWH